MINKKTILFIVLLICSNAFSQTDVAVEQRIQGLIKQMTLKEKVSLLHGNSKFYVSEIKRLGIPEWALSDGPHGVRAEMNRDN
jgi:beta-glucosidase